MSLPTNNKLRPMIEDNDSLIKVLINIMDKATAFVRQFDTQANIIVVFSTSIAFFSVSMAEKEVFVEPFFVLAFFSLLSVFVGLFAIHPPRFMRKKRQKESLIYNKKVTSFPSHAEYKKELMTMFEDKEVFIEEYVLEVYNLYQYYYRPKRKLFNISRNLLVIGFILFFITFLSHGLPSV